MKHFCVYFWGPVRGLLSVAKNFLFRSNACVYITCVLVHSRAKWGAEGQLNFVAVIMVFVDNEGTRVVYY